MKQALIIVDLQQDFCPGGALAVEEGDAVVAPINAVAAQFDTVVATRDWHPADHVSFASNHPGRKVQETVDLDGVEQVLWPDHCVQGTPGAEFHPAFETGPLNLIIHKGGSPGLDSYSAFFENDRTTPTGLDGYLKGLGIEELFICGLATDYCVFFSVMDALAIGYRVNLLQDCVRGVGFPPGIIEERLAAMRDAGALLVNSSEI